MKKVYILWLPNSNETKIGVTKNDPKGRAGLIAHIRNEPVRLFAYTEVDDHRASKLELALKQHFAHERAPHGLGNANGFEWFTTPPEDVLRFMFTLLQPHEVVTKARYVPKGTALQGRKPSEKDQEVHIEPDRRVASFEQLGKPWKPFSVEGIAEDEETNPNKG